MTPDEHPDTLLPPQPHDTQSPGARRVPRIESLRVQNYRVLRDITFKKLTPLTVLIGPNGCGKSTVFDVFAFLSECFSHGLPQTWSDRGGIRELQSRGANGPVVIELKYREEEKRQLPEGGESNKSPSPLITYHLELDEIKGAPVVAKEELLWRRKQHGRPFQFLSYHRGEGEAIPGNAPDEDAERKKQPLRSPDLLAVNTLGQLREHPRVAALRDFISGWYLSYLSVPQMRELARVGIARQLSPTGDNLANVMQFLEEQRPEQLRKIRAALSRRVPQLEEVLTETMRDGRLLIQIKDRPFKDPILARYVSDGTLKLLAYLCVLYDSDPPPLIGIEEPENFVHPKLLRELGEECLVASKTSQILVTTHSPYLLDALKPSQVRILNRGDDGFTTTQSVSDMPLIKDYLLEGGLLGESWMQGMFDLSDKLVDASWVQGCAEHCGAHGARPEQISEF